MLVDIKQALQKLNLDDSYFYLGKNEYADALNVTTDAQEQSQDIVNTNITGNRISSYTFPSGTNTCIGAKEDVLRQRVFEFIWNSNNKHSILIFDVASRVRTKLIENLTDTANVDVLQFTLLNKINHCDIIYRDLSEGDLLFWTDGNVSLRKLNVKHIQDAIYGVVKTQFIELAKQPPRSPILSVYGSDATRNSNSLRKKLIQPTYRFKCDDYEYTTFNTRGKTPLPIGYYGSDNDIDSTKNNFITFTVETGDENVTDIEIAVAFNIDNAWGEYLSVIVLNKLQLGIASNTTYNYLFYNDGVYPPLLQDDVTQLFDWVPQKADSQVMANGNAVVPAGITEGYDPYPQSELDVTITVANQSNVPPDTDPPAITYTSSGNTFVFTVSGSVPTGTEYKIFIFFNGNPGLGQTVGVRLVGDYISIGGDTINSVALALYNQFNSYPSVPIIGGSQSGNFWNSTFGTSGNFVQQINVIAGSSVGTISTEKAYMWDANYLLGQGYKDDQGRLMPGVTTFVDPTDSNNDYLVTTPSFSLNSGNVQTPVITAQVNHLPYVGSVTFGWVRRRMTYDPGFVMYETTDFQDPSDGYLYLCLANIEKYKLANTQFNYGTAPITSESRLKIIAGISSSAYTGDIYNQDYEILGLTIRTPSGGSGHTDDVDFIKIKKPDATISPVYTAHMLVMVYTPLANPTDITNSVYYEWAEEYAIYLGTNIVYTTLTGTFAAKETVTGGTSGATGRIVSDNAATKMTLDTLTGTFVVGETITGHTSGATSHISTISTQNYHRGMTQDQTATQPATYVWAEGDVYFHDRTMYASSLPIASDATVDTVPLMDSNWSDFFLSAVNDNGRGINIDVNALRTYFPATQRFSREYQQNTNINQTNRFVYLNFQDCDRSYGSILKQIIIDRYIKVIQQFKVGFVLLFNQINVDANGNTIQAETDKLLNPIQYYLGDYGCGNAPEACSSFNQACYYVDTNRGIDLRLSQDGNIPISVLFNLNSWFTQHAVLRGKQYKVYSAYDPKSNFRILAFEAAGSDPAFTIAFNESRNEAEKGYITFLSYHPEMMCVIGSLLISWQGGQLWTHDSTTYNNFYGVQYPSYITPVFNDKSQIKKKFLAIGYKSLNNVPWVSDTNGNIQTDTVNPQTLLPQISQLKSVDYELEENILTSAFLFDANSMLDPQLALMEGDYLGGSYLIIKLILPTANSNVLSYISQPYLTWISSGRNF